MGDLDSLRHYRLLLLMLIDYLLFSEVIDITEVANDLTSYTLSFS